LTVSFTPVFPSDERRISRTEILDKVKSTDVYHRRWHYFEPILWRYLRWRSVLDGIAVNVLDDLSGGTPYAEAGEHAHIYIAMPLMPRAARDLSPLRTGGEMPCLIAHVIAAAIESSLAFVAYLYEALNYRWPLTLSVRLEDVQSIALFVGVPGVFQTDPIGPVCLDRLRHNVG
jgi:hypothetical protein